MHWYLSLTACTSKLLLTLDAISVPLHAMPRMDSTSTVTSDRSVVAFASRGGGILSVLVVLALTFKRTLTLDATEVCSNRRWPVLLSTPALTTSEMTTDLSDRADCATNDRPRSRELAIFWRTHSGSTSSILMRRFAS